MVTNNFSFTESASLEWNGPGTLHLKNPSDTSGTLTVNSGCVVLGSGAAWSGNVAVAGGATLEVEGGREDTAFSSNSKVSLNGVLELGSGVSESVAKLSVNGRTVTRDKTYGSSASNSVIADDTHFAGMGVITSAAIKGIEVNFR